MLPVVVISGVVVGLIALLIGGGSKSSGGGGGGAGTPPKGPCTKTISGGILPGEFAAKYAGSAGKWKELLKSNPEMSLVYKHQVLDLSGVWQDCMVPCSLKGPDGTTEQPQRDIEWGLAPWKDGQVVTLPSSWPC